MNIFKILFLFIFSSSFAQNFKSELIWKDETKTREVYKTVTNDYYKITRVTQETPRPFNKPGKDFLDTDDPFTKTEYDVLKDFFNFFIDKKCTSYSTSEECKRANMVFNQYLPNFTTERNEIGYKFLTSNEIEIDKQFTVDLDGIFYVTKINKVNKKSNDFWIITFETVKSLSNNIIESNINVPGNNAKIKTTIASENFIGTLDINPKENKILAMKYEYYVKSSRQQDNNQVTDSSKKVSVILKNKF